MPREILARSTRRSPPLPPSETAMPVEAYIYNRGHAALVACGDCQLCCRDALILLLPELGDDPSQYETQDIAGRTALKVRDDGACWYLGPDGCTIHGRHPVICRAYDCVAHWRSMSRHTRRQALKAGTVRKDVLEAGRHRASR